MRITFLLHNRFTKCDVFAGVIGNEFETVRNPNALETTDKR